MSLLDDSECESIYMLFTTNQMHETLNASP